MRKKGIVLLLITAVLLFVHCETTQHRIPFTTKCKTAQPRIPILIEALQQQKVQYPIRFVYLGDSRKSFKPTDPDGDSIFMIHLKVIDSLKPAFAIHGGDFCLRGYRSEYEHFVSMLDSVSVPVFPAVGNHELYAPEGPEMFKKFFGPGDYYFDYGKYRFIVLQNCHQSAKKNPKGGYYVDYYLSEEQIRWLEDVLRDADRKGLFKIVAAHVPPYIPGHITERCLGADYYYPKPNYEKSHTKQFTDLLERYHVSLGLFSHQHLFDRWEYNGVTYIISGGAGAPLKKPLQEPPRGGSFFHLILFEADSTGEIKGYVYKLGEFKPLEDFTFTVKPPTNN